LLAAHAHPATPAAQLGIVPLTTAGRATIEDPDASGDARRPPCPVRRRVRPPCTAPAA
jgi:hypothetical protein